MKTLLRSAALCALLAASTAHAQQGAPLPQPTPMPPPIPAPQDRAFAGTIKLDIDATDIDRRIFRVKETIPAKPGPHHPALPVLAARRPLASRRA
jgi:hypothetical protein